MRQLQDLHVIATEPLIPPRALKEQLPVDESIANTVFDSRESVRRIISGDDPRTLAIVGPCSIHDREAALDYAQRLVRLRNELEDELFVVMRVYFEKPRTTTGWKGLINDPFMDDTCNMREGVRIARELLLEINRMGLAAATEMLEPITPQYIADLISWTAIGARTTESQTHREMASGLSMPVGFKNTTDGNLQAAIDAIQSARRCHSFLGINQDGMTAIVRTSGNPDGHIVLRGGKTPNYDAHSVEECERLLARAGLTPRLIVDCSHAQTNKDHRKQLTVLAGVLDLVRTGKRSIAGVMLESNINGGNQPVSADRSKLQYGVSVTDPCIDWPTTEHCLREAARVLKATRREPAAAQGG